MPLHIAEFAAESIADARTFQIVALPPLAEQSLTIGGSSLQSAALQPGTRIVRVLSDVACRVALGATPTASATSLPLAAGVAEYFGVQRDAGGAVKKIAVVAG